MFDYKSLVKILLSPTVLATAGGYAGHKVTEKKKDEKWRYIGPAVGAASGYVAGTLARNHLEKIWPSVAPTATAPALAGSPRRRRALRPGEVEIDADYRDDPRPRTVRPQEAPAGSRLRNDAVAEEAGLEDMGSLGDGSGMGSLGGSSASDAAVDDLLRELETGPN